MEQRGETEARGAGLEQGRKPTLRTIAAETGFAVTTVSRALSGDPRISAKTRRVVASAAAAMGYVPDRAAQRLRTGRTKVISLLINPEHEYLGFTDELLAGIVTVLRDTGYSVTIIPDFIDGDRTEPIRNILRNNLADGLIFSRTECFDPRVRLLLEAKFPFITHGRTEFTTPHPYVDYDNEAFARLAVERLVARGCTRLSIILPSARFTFSQHLRYGFLSGVRAADVAYDMVEDVELGAAPDALTRALCARLRGAEPPDGLVCVGEVVALAALAALQDTGGRLGEDLHLVAKRASPVFDLLRPRIDTLYEDVRATGEEIGRLLLRRIQGEPVETLVHVQDPIGGFEAMPPAAP